MGGFHSMAGWLAFNAVALGLVVATQRTRFFAADDVLCRPARESNPTAAYLAPLFAILATAMITGAFSNGSDLFYPLRVLVAGAVLWHYRRAYTDLRLSWSWSAVGIGGAVFVIWVALAPTLERTDTLPAPLAEMPTAWAALWLVFRVFGSVVTVPLAEELAFRSYLLRRLLAPDFQQVQPGRFSWFSFLISSILFGLLHGHWIAGVVAGMLYALALYRRRELGDAVLAHAITNALIAAQVLVLGTWSLWS
jgi:CAAX prenyl protease-like protein